MRLSKISSAIKSTQPNLYTAALISALMASAAVQAEDNAQAEAKDDVEVIEIKGMRGSLASALNEKRDTSNLVEVINAVDIGKLPDQNLAEVLENLTGIQITRTAGVGTGVQIRGSNSNLVQINGASTVGTGSGRSGMKFEDLSAAIIAGVEVTKQPTAKTTEGSVGGTVNLKTIRPLAIGETLASLRVQGEDSSLTTDGIMPRVSGAYGDKWETSAGEFGIVASGSYSLQEATSFRPRVDRDGLVENNMADVIRFNKDGSLNTETPDQRTGAQAFDFLGIQFLNQELENFEYETTNFATTLEFAPNENMKFFADIILTKQEVRQESTRVQASGVSTQINHNVPDEFETINYGNLGGQDLGSIEAALKGTIDVNLGIDDDDPNLRFNSDTGARKTDTSLVRLGGEWQITDELFVKAEYSKATSTTETPKLNTQLNFINPNAPVDKLDENGDYTKDSSNDNSVPFVYDLTGGDLTFGIDTNSMYAPSVAQLLDPKNVVLDQLDFSHGDVENSDEVFRIDASYYLDGVVSSIDVGLRYNKATHEAVSTSDKIGGFSKMKDSPSGALFADLLVAGPDNFDDADGRDLAIRNFIIIDPDLAYENPEEVIAKLHDAMDAHRADMEALGIEFTSAPDYLKTEPSETDAFKVEETTTALYAQANFDWEMIRGDVGVRYVESEVSSFGVTKIDDVFTTVTYEGDYDYLLPRINLVADVTDDIVLRAGWGKDIKRPSFGNLNTNASFNSSENQAVSIGNPDLEPEEVTTFDISAEWYFAEAAVVSIGYFEKDITNLHVSGLNSAAPLANNGRETDPSCPGGGVFNPIAEPNIFNSGGSVGMCVDAETSVNDSATVTQSGIEMAFQYDLSDFESELGWASGFGIQANYTIQEYKGGSVENESATRGTDIFNAINGVYDIREFESVTAVQGLLDFSENAYNITLYYEKFGLSARMRYTWREAFRTDDTAAGASRNSTLGFPVYTHDRGQLNASVSYDVTEKLNLGVEAVNLTKSEITQSCVNEGAQLCFQGLADRRITFGATYRF